MHASLASQSAPSVRLAEVAQALGADVLVHGSVGRYGALYAVNLSLFDAKAGGAVGGGFLEESRPAHETETWFPGVGS